MASWWRKITMDLGGPVPGVKGPWEEHAAHRLEAETSRGQSWAEKVAAKCGVQHAQGSWAKRMMPVGTTGRGPIAKILAINNILPSYQTPAVYSLLPNLK